MMVEWADRLDLDVLREMIRHQDLQTGIIMPMLDPTRWLREHKGLEAAVRVTQAAAEFARVIRENKAGAGG